MKRVFILLVLIMLVCGCGPTGAVDAQARDLVQKTIDRTVLAKINNGALSIEFPLSRQAPVADAWETVPKVICALRPTYPDNPVDVIGTITIDGKDVQGVTMSFHPSRPVECEKRLASDFNIEKYVMSFYIHPSLRR